MTENEIVMVYKSMMAELQQLSQKIAELEAERNEHQYVVCSSVYEIHAALC